MLMARQWVRKPYYAYLKERPGIRIAICKVYGQERYAVYCNGELKAVRTDKEQAKKIAEDAYDSLLAVAAHDEQLLAECDNQGQAKGPDK